MTVPEKKKKRKGRPVPARYTTSLLVRCRPELLQRLDAVLDTRVAGVSRSEAVREAIEAWVEERETKR